MQTVDTKRLKIDQSVLKILYIRCKPYLISVLIITASVMLFVFFVMPQIQEIFVIRAQEDLTKEKIITLQKNLEFVASLDDIDLDSQLQIVSGALPGEKDFIGVLNAIRSASVKSGVSVGDYVFQVGSLSQETEKSSGNIGSFPSLSLSLELKDGGIEGVRRFLNSLAKIIPISEVNGVDSAENRSKMTIVFYYRAIPPISVDYTALIKPLSKGQEATFKDVSSWMLEESLPFANSSGSL
ncbi:MAG: hypothetical protein ABH816_03670 [Candidatus Levyibacteriota bacterium]